MGRSMKVFAVLLFAALAVAVLGAPLTPEAQEKLLSNIEKAAQKGVDKANAQIGDINAKAVQESDVLQNDAAELAEVESSDRDDKNAIDKMKSEEKEGIADSSKIRMQALDQAKSYTPSAVKEEITDARKWSKRVQETAEQIDTDYEKRIERVQTSEETLKQIDNKNINQLGESKEDSEGKIDFQDPGPLSEGGGFKERLQAVEKSANEAVTTANEEEKQAEHHLEDGQVSAVKHLKHDKKEVVALKAAKKHLYTDIQGHKDRDLEKSIEEEANLDRERTMLGESDLPDGLKAAEKAAHSAAESEDASVDQNESSEDQDKPKALSRSEQDSEQVAYNAEDHSNAEESPEDKAAAEPKETAAEESPEDKAAAEPKETAAEAPVDHSKKIAKDAKALMDYQENAITEMKKQWSMSKAASKA